MPELIQGRVNVRNLVRAAENLMVEPLRTETRDALLALRARLGEPGAAARVAAIALEMMDEIRRATGRVRAGSAGSR